MSQTKWYKTLFLKNLVIIWVAIVCTGIVTQYILGKNVIKNNVLGTMADKQLQIANIVVSNFLRNNDKQGALDFLLEAENKTGLDFRLIMPNELPIQLGQTEITSQDYLDWENKTQQHILNEMPLILGHKIMPFESDEWILLAVVRPQWMADFTQFRFKKRSQMVWVILVFSLATIFISYLTSRPLSKLSQFLQSFSQYDTHIRIPPAITNRGDEFAYVAQNFNLMADQIERYVQQQKSLFMEISHELRSPLARLDIATELAKERSGGAVSGELSRIALESERINQLIHEILTLSKLDRDSATQAKETFSLQQLIKDATDDLKFDPLAKDITINSTLEICKDIIGKPELLKRALENILRNAASFSGPGTQLWITLSEGPDSRYQTIKIRDSGPGVSENDLPHLFTPFFRAKDQSTRKTKGFGLGLAIAARVMQLQKGHIEARNAKEGGLEVIMKINVNA